MGTDQLRITLRRHRTGLAMGIAVISLALFALLAMGGPSRGVAAGPEDPADLSLTKSDSPDPVTEGAVLTYTILVSNAGPDPATNVVVTDDLPKQVKFVSATASSGSCQSPPGKGKGGKVECNLGTLSNGGTATVTIRTTATKAGDISNTASVTSDVTDPQTANNSDTEATKVLAAPNGPTCANKKATIVGTPGDDLLVGTPGNDVILALAGNDTVFARDGKDLVCAQGGADFVNSGARPDLVKAGSGPDLVKGRGG